jgi:hypothetical protein
MFRIAKWWAGVVLALLASGYANAQTFEFKGLVLGAQSSVKVLEEQHGVKCNEATRSENGIKCSGVTTLFGESASLEMYLNGQNVISYIHVRHHGNILKFKDMVKSIAEKFGPPMKMSGYTAEWRKGNGQVEQQWVQFQPETFELRIVRLDAPKNPAFLLRNKDKKDF